MDQTPQSLAYTVGSGFMASSAIQTPVINFGVQNTQVFPAAQSGPTSPPPGPPPLLHVSSGASYCEPPTSSQLQQPSTLGAFAVKFIEGNISVCQGCRNKYPKNPLPPQDLCLQHQEWREFTPAGSVIPQYRWDNAYYHCSSQCVRARWPSFITLSITIDPLTKGKLHPSHRTFLVDRFGLHV